jgi:hypothetical protein
MSNIPIERHFKLIVEFPKKDEIKAEIYNLVLLFLLSQYPVKHPLGKVQSKSYETKYSVIFCNQHAKLLSPFKKLISITKLEGAVFKTTPQEACKTYYEELTKDRAVASKAKRIGAVTNSVYVVYFDNDQKTVLDPSLEFITSASTKTLVICSDENLAHRSAAAFPCSRFFVPRDLNGESILSFLNDYCTIDWIESVSLEHSDRQSSVAFFPDDPWRKI